MTQAPSNQLFVIDARRDRESAACRLAPLGNAQPIEQNENLLLLSIPANSGDPESRWARVQALLGELGTAQPALLDETGAAHLPTGEISVRFHEAQPEERLQEFAAEHGLRLRDRNEFVPQQAVFQPTDLASSYIPRLLQELAQTKDTKAVWANTLTRFSRAY